ncbi:expressed unknown protein [Seminavis robusta]|uniref:Uncharacterized protein n=1 Tax=Seminavis robusta TaxID=568900 RepID=A0A9N8H6J1_9STRA|nr:expressed unknown protein [Seminavis robusta]|eukprot:Sro148_g068250.1 n/a (626) ;mRNA; f:89320-91197
MRQRTIARKRVESIPASQWGVTKEQFQEFIAIVRRHQELGLIQNVDPRSDKNANDDDDEDTTVEIARSTERETTHSGDRIMERSDSRRACDLASELCCLAVDFAVMLPVCCFWGALCLGLTRCGRDPICTGCNGKYKLYWSDVFCPTPRKTTTKTKKTKRQPRLHQQTTVTIQSEACRISTRQNSSYYSNEKFRDPNIGPNIHQVNAQIIKPLTKGSSRQALHPTKSEFAWSKLAGGGAVKKTSWALMKNPNGSPPVQLFVSHAWDAGIYEMANHLLAVWPDDCEAAYICFLSNPQNLDMSDTIAGTSRFGLERSPFAMAMKNPNTRQFVMLATQNTPIHTRLWCCFEALLALKFQIPITICGDETYLRTVQRQDADLQKRQMEAYQKRQSQLKIRLQEATSGMDDAKAHVLTILGIVACGVYHALGLSLWAPVGLVMSLTVAGPLAAVMATIVVMFHASATCASSSSSSFLDRLKYIGKAVLAIFASFILVPAGLLLGSITLEFFGNISRNNAVWSDTAMGLVAMFVLSCAVVNLWLKFDRACDSWSQKAILEQGARQEESTQIRVAEERALDEIRHFAVDVTQAGASNRNDQTALLAAIGADAKNVNDRLTALIRGNRIRRQD